MDFRKADFNKHREFIGKISQVTNVKKKTRLLEGLLRALRNLFGVQMLVGK